MAKNDVHDVDTAMAAKVAEFKKELLKVMREIVDDDVCEVEKLDEARGILCSLKELKLTRTNSLNLKEPANIPEEFLCPISRKMMRDPVIISTGQTYDRSSMEKWFNSGHHTCPRTQLPLAHSSLTPNCLIRELITKWCITYGIAEVNRDHFFALLAKMSSTLPEKKEAAKELRMLTKRTPSFRALFGESTDAIPKLLTPLAEAKSLSLDLQEDLVTTLLNISIHDSNKKIVAETPSAIPLLIECLKTGTIETRRNAAATLFTLSALDSNKEIIGKSGAMKQLIDLLEEGHGLAVKDSAAAIFSLCVLHENKSRAVNDGGVGVILKKIMNNVLVDELLAILAMLCSDYRAIEEMGELGGVACLLGIMRESSCARVKENCIAILHTMCFNDRNRLKEMREEERVHGTISEVFQNGSSRARRKACGILERLNRGVNIIHTA